MLVFSLDEYMYSNLHDEALEHSWQLFRYAGKKQTTLTGFPIEPAYELGGITAEQVLEALHRKSSFLWDYEPRRGDYMLVHCRYLVHADPKKPRPSVGGFMAFINNGDNWVFNTYDPFEDELTPLQKGYILDDSRPQKRVR